MSRPKPLLPWEGGTLLAYQVRELVAAGVEDIIVVLGHQAESIRPSVPQSARAVVNGAYREGRASSLRAGAAALPDGAGPIVVLNVDQPRPRDVTRTLLDAHVDSGSAITVPVSGARRGHPTVLDGALLDELRAASEDEQGLRGIIARHENDIHKIESQPVVLLDINTPIEYQEARETFRSESTSS